MSILSEELQKSLDAAFLAARTDGHDLLTVEHLLLALLSDTNVAEVLNATGADLESLEQGVKDTHAVFLLNEQGVTRLDIVNYISHGIAKNAPSAPEAQPEQEERDGAG